MSDKYWILEFRPIDQPKWIQVDVNNCILEPEQVKEYEEHIFRLKSVHYSSASLYVNKQRLDSEFPSTNVVEWKWNPGGLVGEHLVLLTMDELSPVEFHLLVKPTSIQWDHFIKMKNDIRQVAYNLLYHFHGKSIAFTRKEYDYSLEDIQEQLKKLYETIRKVQPPLRRIEISPFKHLKKELVLLPIKKVRKPDIRNFQFLLSHSYRMTPTSKMPEIKWFPRKLLDQRIVYDVDVYENRLIRHFLANILLAKLLNLKKRIPKEIGELKDQKKYRSVEKKLERLIRAEEMCDDLINNIRLALQNYSFLAKAGKYRQRSVPSQVLLFHPDYRTFFELYHDFLKNHIADFDSNSFWLRLKQMPELYEIWCVLRVLEMCRNNKKVEIVQESLFSKDEHVFTLRLLKGAKNPLMKMRTDTGIIKVFYEKIYSFKDSKNGFYSLANKRIPDIAIEHWSKDLEKAQVFLLDAKYRRKTKKSREEIYNKMASYFSDIAFKEERNIVFRSCALWPSESDLPPSRIGFYNFTPNSKALDFEEDLYEFLNLDLQKI